MEQSEQSSVQSKVQEVQEGAHKDAYNDHIHIVWLKSW